MNKQRLELIYDLGSVKPIEIWEIMFTRLRQEKFNDEEVNLSGRELSLNKVSKAIIKSNMRHFGVHTRQAYFDFSPLTNSKHILVDIDEKINHFIPWDEWISDFLKLDGFIQAWVSDLEYHYWQNAADPIEYTTRGRSYEDLPMKSNGLPYPMEQMVIDTSANVARREIKVGYVEAIGCPMWLGDLFWQYSVNNKDVIISELGDKVKELDGVICIEMVNGTFEDSSTANEQRQLRSLLYGLHS